MQSINHHVFHSSVHDMPPSNGNHSFHDEIRDIIKITDNAFLPGSNAHEENQVMQRLEAMDQRYPPSEIAHALNQSYGTRHPMSIAGKFAERGFANALRFALDHGTDLAQNQAVIEEILSCGLFGLPFDKIFNVLKDNPTIDWNVPLTSRGNATLFALHAHMEHSTEVQQLLTVEGVDPNLSRNSWLTPLGNAISFNKFDLFNLLVASPRTDINRKDGAGRAAIEIMLQNIRQDVTHTGKYVKYIAPLIEHAEFDPDTTLSTGESLLDYASRNGMPELAARLKEIKALRLRQQSEAQCHEANRIMEAAENRLGSESIHFKRLQALDIRSRQYCAHLLEPVLQQQAAAIQEQPNMTKAQLDTMEADFSTAVSAALEKISAMQSDKLVLETAKRFPKGSEPRARLEQLTPQQRREAANLLNQSLFMKPAQHMSRLQLESIVHEVLETIRQWQLLAAAAGKQADASAEIDWPDIS